MKIFVLEDHSIPSANMYVFWKVGSRNEYPGITGLAHFFEHMMFNGARKYGPKQFDRFMESQGGSNNAYTTENMTVYTDWFPSSALESIFDLESDRIAHLQFDDAMIESERQVVSSERSTGLENNNWSFMEEALLGTAFTAHPYAFPVIGFQSDIDNWSKQDLQNFFRSYYAPNNAVVVIAGDVSLAKVQQLANRYFAPIPGREPPRKIHTVEPEQLGEKRFYLHKPSVSTPHLWIVYHTPATPSSDTYALQLLSSILSAGESSRLYHHLVDDLQIANEVSAYLPNSFDPYLLNINAVAANGVSAEKLEKEILSVLQQVVQHGVTERELQKVKNQALMGFYQAMETINSKAEFVGMYENYFGGVQKLFTAPDEINQVTVADIQRVAQQYLKKSNRTVGILGNWEDK